MQRLPRQAHLNLLHAMSHVCDAQPSQHSATLISDWGSPAHLQGCTGDGLEAIDSQAPVEGAQPLFLSHLPHAVPVAPVHQPRLAQCPIQLHSSPDSVCRVGNRLHAKVHRAHYLASHKIQRCKWCPKPYNSCLASTFSQENQTDNAALND